MFPYVAEINLPGSIHLTFFGLVIPLLMVRGRIKLRNTEAPLPNRLRHSRRQRSRSWLNLSPAYEKRATFR
ncbi:MAG: hypothetical protein QOG23_573 [Blastocatellia bacterium]|jgi:hypothetical protein|nr:hypothetical protein [Blastocatellia bacterium]